MIVCMFSSECLLVLVKFWLVVSGWLSIWDNILSICCSFMLFLVWVVVGGCVGFLSSVSNVLW